MNTLLIESTKLCPKVEFNPDRNIFEISGESIPENAADFYNPLLKWLDDYELRLYYMKTESGKSAKLTLDIKYDYFNSTSAKFILDIFTKIQKFIIEGYEAQINWHYQKGDTDMLEAGEELGGLCPKLIIEYKEM